MTWKRAGLLAVLLVLGGAVVGWAVVRVPRAVNGPIGPNDRLGDIKRRLPNIPSTQGDTPGSVLPPFVRGELGLTGTQHQRIADLERETAEKLTDILTPEQMRKFEELIRRGPDRPGVPQ